MLRPTADFALLTPVQEEHLISGLEICDLYGRVMYGSNSTMVLSEFNNDLKTGGVDADVLIYASRGSETPGKVSYRARFESYIGATSSGKAPKEYANFRPPSTELDGRWDSFYIVSNLEKLLAPIRVSELRGRDKKTTFKKNYIPHGPVIIDCIS